MVATEYTGVHGTVTIEAGATVISEFSLKIDRGVASHARSGKYSDYQVPGKVTVTGTINRMMITKTWLDYASKRTDVSGAIIDLVGTLTNGADTIVVTANNCFVTSGEFKFTDADEIVSDPITFAMQDAHADLTIT